MIDGFSYGQGPTPEAAARESGLQLSEEQWAILKAGGEIRCGYSVYRLWGHRWVGYAKAPPRPPLQGWSDLGLKGNDFGTEAEALAFASANIDPRNLAEGYTPAAHSPCFGFGHDISPPTDSPMGRHFVELAAQAEATAEAERFYNE